MISALVLGTALAAEPSATGDLLGGSSAKGQWTTSVIGGFPWFGGRGQLGLGKRMSLMSEFNTAIGNRFQPSIGGSVSLVEGTAGKVSAEALLGWQFQHGALPQYGPSALVGVRAAGRLGPVWPYLHLHSRSVLRGDRTILVTADGEDRSMAWSHRWTPSVMGGVGVHITRGFGLDLGMGYHWADVGAYEVRIPAIRAALHVGGGA